MTLRGALVVLLLLGTTGCASARPPASPGNPNLTCELREDTTYVDSLKKLPPAVMAALTMSAGAMADRGEFFNAGDVVTKPAPFNRFIRAGSLGRYWFVWYEHGGIAYWHQIVIFVLDREGKVRILNNRRATKSNLCAETDDLLGID